MRETEVIEFKRTWRFLGFNNERYISKYVPEKMLIFSGRSYDACDDFCWD